MAITKPTKPYTFANGAGETADATEVNEDFDILYAKMDELIDAINNAAGSKAALATRLMVALNDDGTLKASSTAGGEWINPALSPLYVAGNQFSCTGNHTDIYLALRRIKATLAASTVYTEVLSSSYSAGTGKTTVTLKDSVLTNPLTSIEHCVLTPISATSALSVSMLGGLTSKEIESGPWDMDTDATISVPHGLIGSRIKFVEVRVQDDTQLEYAPIDFGNLTTGNVGGTCRWDTTNIILARMPGGDYDSSEYADDSINRAILTVWYVN